MENNWEQ
jgi:hypothetical protein